MLIEQVSTERIEAAIARMKDPASNKITFVQHLQIIDDDGGPKTERYTLPDLYRELARRYEAGVSLIREALTDAAKVFEEE